MFQSPSFLQNMLLQFTINCVIRKFYKARFYVLCIVPTLLIVAYVITSNYNVLKATSLGNQFSFSQNLELTIMSKTFQKARKNFNTKVYYRQGKEFKVLSEVELRDFYMKNCSWCLENVLINITDRKDHLLPLKEYKNQLARNFTAKYSNPINKSKSVGELSFRVGWITPNPKERLRDPDVQIDVAFINSVVKNDSRNRHLHGDGDMLQISEVKEELKTSRYKIPNIIHFIWFGKQRRFRIDHYLAFAGALRYQRPKVILFHYDAFPIGEYWDEAQRLSGNKLKIVKRTPPTKIFGRDVKEVAHQADVARLHILMEVGGIYLDTDSVILKPLHSFRHFKMVMPESDWATLANGIILANRNAWFLRRWYHEYKYFLDDVWGFNSVLVPWSIAHYFPNTIHVVKNVMCRPSWSEVELIYRNKIVWKHIYIMHLYSREMETQDGTAERPLKQLAVLNTTYGEIARHVIWGDKHIRDITDWIITCNLTRALTEEKEI